MPIMVATNEGATKLNTSNTTAPTPTIYTGICVRVVGPYSQVEQFRKWFKESFATWSTPFRSKGYDLGGRARRDGGALWVYIDMKGSARDLIGNLVELFEWDFPGLRIASGSASERSNWYFDSCNGAVTALVERFTDTNGQEWRGRHGAYEAVPFEDEDEAELPNEPETRPGNVFPQPAGDIAGDYSLTIY
jgi:hypothetical protein